MPAEDHTVELAREVVAKLAERSERIVLAESCTAGLVAATLATIPGVSEQLCGSAVTYRNDTKIRWLGIDAETLEQHTAVSVHVTHQMAVNVLRTTPEATWSASVTGHLGPNAPKELDGKVFIGTARRSDSGILPPKLSQHQLETTERTARQREATSLVLQRILKSF